MNSADVCRAAAYETRPMPRRSSLSAWMIPWDWKSAFDRSIPRTVVVGGPEELSVMLRTYHCVQLFYNLERPWDGGHAL